MTLSIVGKPITKVDVLDKVLGKAKYLDDLDFPNTLYAKLLRSEYPHARILSIDISKAEKLDGVKAIILSKDVPVNIYGIQYKNQPVLAGERVRYLGDPVAAVAATSAELVEEALELIDVKYKELPTVFDPQKALDSASPKIHDNGNLAVHRKIRSGNVEKGFAVADTIIEDQFSTQKIEHCHIEPHGAAASVDANDKITVWASLPQPFIAQAEIARVLNIPITQVRIIQPECGGSFGGRNEISIEPHVALLAIKTHQPVKMIRSREEEFTSSTTRHSFTFTYKTGVKNDGQLTAREVKMICDAGAYYSYGESTLTKACILASGPYRIPNMKVDGYLVYTNNQVGGAMRGFGGPQVTAAEETHMDHIATTLGINPLELRLRNCFKLGDKTATGQVLRSVGLTQTITEAAKAANWKRRSLHKGFANQQLIMEGEGVACMFYPIGFTEKANPSSAIVKINLDGTMIVQFGAVDVGQGAKTVLSQIAAEELGVSIKQVKVVSGDTDSDPYDVGSVASRVTYAAGNAVRLATKKAKKMLLETAAEKLSVNTEVLKIEESLIYVKGSSKKCISIGETVEILYQKGQPLITTASFNPSNSLLDPETGQGYPYPTYVYATQIAKVEVNTKTGFVKVKKMIAAHDVGKAINPDTLRGQIIGGIGFGLGQALREDMILDKGVTLNPNFVDYLIPLSTDMPEVSIQIIEEVEPTGPFGAKGVAEPANIATVPAILNAIYDAVGVRINNLPATSEKILKALQSETSNLF